MSVTMLVAAKGALEDTPAFKKLLRGEELTPVEWTFLDLEKPLFKVQVIYHNYVGYALQQYVCSTIQEQWALGMDGWEHRFLYERRGNGS